MSDRRLSFSTSKAPPYIALFAFHNAPWPNTTQNTKLINAKHCPNQVECKPKLITCKQQNNTKTKKKKQRNNKTTQKQKRRSKGITAPSKFHDYQLSPLLAFSVSPNLHTTSSIKSFSHLALIWALFTQQKPRHKSRSQWNQYKHWKFLPFFKVIVLPL